MIMFVFVSTILTFAVPACGTRIYTLSSSTWLGVSDSTFAVLSAYCKPLQSHRLHFFGLYLESTAAASGRPSMWDVLSAFMRLVTPDPQAFSEAGPIARG